MGKKKGFKVQTYKVPQEKFVVVTKAWGVDLRHDLTPYHFNKVGAWFEVMLRDKYPGTSVHTIYHQRTHRNLIVELPRQVTDISPYLGRHLHATFLIEEPLSEEFSEIYEYKYSRHGDPGGKSWTAAFPNPQKIPEGFFRSPYPFPVRASERPPVDIADYAYPIPNDVYTQRQALVDKAIAAAVVASTSAPIPPKFSFIRDDSQLGNSTDNAASTSRLPEVPVKQTPSLLVKLEQTDTFLASSESQSCVNDEESARNTTEAEEDDYNPSAELLAMLADLPPELNPLRDEQESEVDVSPDIFVKPEPVDDALPEYTPSENLLSSLASLPPGILSLNQPPVKNEVDAELPVFRVKDEPRDISIGLAAVQRTPEFDIRVKPEPIDDILFGDYLTRSRERRSTSHPYDRIPREDTAHVTGEFKPEDSKVNIQVKPEPEDDAQYLDCPPRRHVKVERDVVEAVGSASRTGRPKAEHDDSASGTRGMSSRMEARIKAEAKDDSQSDGYQHTRDDGRFDEHPHRGRSSREPEFHANTKPASHRGFRGKLEPEKDGRLRDRGHERESMSRDYRGHRVDQPNGYGSRPKRESSPPYLEVEKRVRFKGEHGEGEPRHWIR